MQVTTSPTPPPLALSPSLLYSLFLLSLSPLSILLVSTLRPHGLTALPSRQKIYLGNLAESLSLSFLSYISPLSTLDRYPSPHYLFSFFSLLYLFPISFLAIPLILIKKSRRTHDPADKPSAVHVPPVPHLVGFQRLHTRPRSLPLVHRIHQIATPLTTTSPSPHPLRPPDLLDSILSRVSSPSRVTSTTPSRPRPLPSGVNVKPSPPPSFPAV